MAIDKVNLWVKAAPPIVNAADDQTAAPQSDESAKRLHISM